MEAAHARQNFSIRDLNDEIIAKCQEKGGVATLADVVEDKDPTKLCCYMLSSLLLVNNIDMPPIFYIFYYNFEYSMVDKPGQRRSTNR